MIQKLMPLIGALILFAATTSVARSDAAVTFGPVPTNCNGIPWVSGGADGCGPIRLGDDMTGSVEVRMAGGETFSVWQDGAWTLAIENTGQASLATFHGHVRARSFAHAQPVHRTSDFAVMEGENTIMVDPQGGVIHAYLPVAIYYPGRRVTIKLIGPGSVDIFGTVNAWTGIQDPIDTGSHFAMLDPAGADHPAVTLEAYDLDDDNNASTPAPTGWVVVSQYP
jgi:hypothetical protein